MRNATRLFALLTVVGLPVGVRAMGHGHGHGKPQPIPCPADVATALATQCPCAGAMEPNNPEPNAPVSPWRNHGQYVKCVVHYRNALRKAGCLTAATRSTLASCAARSTCGKSRVLCCHYNLGVCNDPTPGDMVATGMCSNDPNAVCDVSADCTKSTPRIERDATACMADGGVVVEGGGSVCTPCPPPPSTTTTTTTLATTTTTL
jgi:hypothetical protein